MSLISRSFQNTKGLDTDERDRPSSVILDRAPKYRVQRNQPQILPTQITNDETEVDDSNMVSACVHQM